MYLQSTETDCLVLGGAKTTINVCYPCSVNASYTTELVVELQGVPTKSRQCWLIVKLGSRPCPCQLLMTTGQHQHQTHSLSLLSRSGPRADSIIAI